jgi:F-type H+-transporting ATPase subunit a
MFPNFDLNGFINHHIGNSHEWHIFPSLSPVPLPGFLTFHALMLLIGTAILFILFLVLYRKEDRVPTGITNALEFFVVYIRDEIAIPNMGEKDGLSFTPMLCSLFFFILILNLMGLVPIFGAATSNLNLTGALGFLTFVLMVGGTLMRHGPMGLWHALIPSGIPKPMKPFLIPLLIVTETFSVFVRSVAMMMRLFANMMAGHIVIMSFLGLFVVFGWAASLALPMAVFFYCLEIFVAFLQAYIFILLSAIFIGQMWHPKH